MNISKPSMVLKPASVKLEECIMRGDAAVIKYPSFLDIIYIKILVLFLLCHEYCDYG